MSWLRSSACLAYCDVVNVVTWQLAQPVLVNSSLPFSTSGAAQLRCARTDSSEMYTVASARSVSLYSAVAAPQLVCAEPQSGLGNTDVSTPMSVLSAPATWCRTLA